MTEYLWDTSHYDGDLSVATFVNAKAQGIVAVTHKLGEGADTSLDDPLAGEALANARLAGMQLLGGYHVVRSGDPAAQVASAMRIMNAVVPWWSTFPGWFGQTDLERWPYDNVPAATGIAFGNGWRTAMARVVVMYASRGEYGDGLTAWSGDLWNADYVSGSGDFKALYPGDDWVPGWAPYSGRDPAYLQYTSSATIGGTTTSDCSAFRGTFDELYARLTGRPINKGDDMGVYVLSGFPGQPDWTEGAYHVADNSLQGYHVAPREPGMNAAAWPNAPHLASGANVPAKYPYATTGGQQGITEVLFGDPQSASSGGGLTAHSHAVSAATGPAVPTA